MVNLDLSKMVKEPRDFLKIALFDILGRTENKNLCDSLAPPQNDACTVSLIINGQSFDLIPFFQHLEKCWNDAVVQEAQRILQERFAKIYNMSELLLEQLKDANSSL